jgi:hypothetical protein
MIPHLITGFTIGLAIADAFLLVGIAYLLLEGNHILKQIKDKL